jgi:hypothetical protein
MSGKYVPPHLRGGVKKDSTADSSTVFKQSRQIVSASTSASDITSSSSGKGNGRWKETPSSSLRVESLSISPPPPTTFTCTGLEGELVVGSTELPEGTDFMDPASVSRSLPSIAGNVSADQKKSFFFKFIDPDIRRSMQLDSEASYSVTNQRDADVMSENILAYFNENFVDSSSPACAVSITDGTACVGGNTLSFARYFSKVNAVEIDETRCRMLARNIALVKASWAAKVLTDSGAVEKDYGDITVLQGDLSKSFASPLLKQDIFFLDPPWGGPEMMKKRSVTFPLGSTPLPLLCMALKPYCSFVALKLSDNYDLGEFGRCGLPLALTEFRNFRKMILVIVSFVEERKV